MINLLSSPRKLLEATINDSVPIKSEYVGMETNEEALRMSSA